MNDCERGAIGRGMLSLARGLSLARKAAATDLEPGIRTSLGYWGSRLSTLRAIMVHNGPVLTAAFSPDGDRIVTGGRAVGQLWKATGEPVGPPLKHGEPVTGSFFADDGKAVLTYSQFRRAWLWDAATGNLLGERVGVGGPMRRVLFVRNGRDCVVVTDGNARVQNTASGRTRGEPLKHPRGIEIAELSPNGQVLATADPDNQFRLWNVDTGELIHSGSFATFQGVAALAFSPDSKRLVIACRMGVGVLCDGPRARRCKT